MDLDEVAEGDGSVSEVAQGSKPVGEESDPDPSGFSSPELPVRFPDVPDGLEEQVYSTFAPSP